MAKWVINVRRGVVHGRYIWTAVAGRDGRPMYDGMGESIEHALVDLGEALCEALEEADGGD